MQLRHSLLLDGVFNIKTNRFHPAPTLQDGDVKQIVETTALRVKELLVRRGILDNDFDQLADEQPLLAGMTSASVLGLVSTGERAGQRVRRVLSDPAEAVRTGDLCYASSGFSLSPTVRLGPGSRRSHFIACKTRSKP